MPTTGGKDKGKTAKSIALSFSSTGKIGAKSTDSTNKQLAVTASVKPTPLEFDLFVPWLSLKWEIPYTVFVTKELQGTVNDTLEYPFLFDSLPQEKLPSYLVVDCTYRKTNSVAAAPVLTTLVAVEEYISVLKARRGSRAGIKLKNKKEEKQASEIGLGDQAKILSRHQLKMKHLIINYDEQSIIQDSLKQKLHDLETIIHITAYYDCHDNLVEVTFNDTSAQLPKSLIQVLLICAPFHNSLYKLTFRKIRWRTSTMAYLATYIQQSYLTDLILDDSPISNVDFQVIFDTTTPLKRVSVARCKLGDDSIVLIAARLCHNQPGSKSLVSLNLTGNKVQDRGARALARMLRTNRQLAHLNLAQNLITDEGACAILDSLQEYPLTYEEYVSSRARGMEYCSQKHIIYKSCLEEIVRQASVKKFPPTKTQSPGKPNRSKSEMKKASEPKDRNEDPGALAEVMAVGIMGEFADPYDSSNTVKKDGYRFCLGNKCLCFLNLSYNDLYFPTLTKLINVLEWQKKWTQPHCGQQPSGLIRVVLDGNAFPIECEELTIIARNLAAKTVFGYESISSLRKDSVLQRGKRAASARK